LILSARPVNISDDLGYLGKKTQGIFLLEELLSRFILRCLELEAIIP